MKYPFAAKSLMAPGPVPIPPVVEEIFSSCHVHHRTADFSQVLQRVLGNLKRVFQTKEHSFVLPATGTGAMEAALVNTMSIGDEVVVVEAGKFGERWQELALAFGLEVKIVKVPWGESVEPKAVASAIGPKTKAVLVQVCETSTGALHPVEALGQLCLEHGILLIADGITAVAAIDVPMDAWNVDILIGGSQKGFMLPTGLSMLALSEKAQQFQKTSQIAKYYWNLEEEAIANIQGKTRYSTPAHFILALDAVMENYLLKPSLKDYFKTIEERAQLFRDKVQLPLFSKIPSASLSCLVVPEGRSSKSLQKYLYETHDISVVAGQGVIQDRVLRVGHMGFMAPADLVRTAEAINQWL